MADERILGVISGTRNGKPFVITTPTRCNEPTSGEVYQGIVSGTRNGKPLMLISRYRCDGTSTLANGETYLGLLSGTRNGRPLVVVPCGACVPNPYCCEYVLDSGITHLSATVTIAGMPSSPFVVQLNKQSQPPGTEDCYQTFSGTLAGDTFTGGWTITAAIACQLAPKCNEWHFTVTVRETAGATTYEVSGTEPTNLASDPPVIMDTISTNAIYPRPGIFDPLQDCCADVPGWAGPAEYGCGIYSTYANLSGAAITIDVTE